MKIIVSPTKTQKRTSIKVDSTSFRPELTTSIWNLISKFSVQEIIQNYKVSEKLAQSIKDELSTFDSSSIAIQTYLGSSFKNMNLNNWSTEDYDYAQEHLVILSALYGVVKPMDGITLYRLDFNTKTEISLYDSWRGHITDYFNEVGQDIISLASEEYEKMIDTKNLKVKIVKVQFLESTPKGYVSKATYAKIARGKMVDLIIKNRIDSYDELIKLKFDNYSYSEDLSNSNLITFLR